MECIRRQRGASLAAEQAAQREQVGCADNANPNSRKFEEDRYENPEFNHWHAGCKVHQAQNILTDTMKPIAWFVSLFVRMILSVQPLG